jgi:Tol biopolymer transport system component
MLHLVDRLSGAMVNVHCRDGSVAPAHSTAARGRPCLVPLVLVAASCGSKGIIGPTITLLDRDRHAHFTANVQSIVYYRQDERGGASPGIYRVDLASGDVTLLAEALLAGLDLNPQTDSIVFSARASGEVEPALWIMGLGGGGVRRLGGGGNTVPGYRWPAFSPDGSHIVWEVRYQNDPNLDTVSTLWMGDWQGDSIANARAVGPGRHAAWRPDGAAFAVERRRPGDVVPYVIAVMDTTGQLLDTLGYGYEPTWRPDGARVAYLAQPDADRGCLGVCLVPAGGGTPVALSADFMSYPGTWTPNGAKFVYARLMRTYSVTDEPPIEVEESRLWIRTLATGADEQVTF